jgi:hypothetical protein
MRVFTKLDGCKLVLPENVQFDAIEEFPDHTCIIYQTDSNKVQTKCIKERVPAILVKRIKEIHKQRKKGGLYQAKLNTSCKRCLRPILRGMAVGTSSSEGTHHAKCELLRYWPPFWAWNELSKEEILAGRILPMPTEEEIAAAEEMIRIEGWSKWAKSA